MQSIAMDIMLQTQSAEKSSRPMEENTKNNTEKFDYILEKLVEESNELSVEKSGFKKQKHQSKIISENDIEGIEKDNSGSDKKSGTEISRVENKTVEFNLIYDKIYEFLLNMTDDNPKANVIDAVSKPETIRQPVTMAEKIISQVVSKAKVIVDGQKSEMVINLKPDSLGKLSMKVMTENKLVTAEIIAENYQVKQVIESGMQQLKQSLEEQGMFIQDLSVSVRQDGKKDTRNSMSNKKNDDGYPNEIEKQNGMSEYLNNPMDIPLKNPYILNESTINLTA
jgi:flagellar hook-length control protein FliK